MEAGETPMWGKTPSAGKVLSSGAWFSVETERSLGKVATLILSLSFGVLTI
jgi:hypothetical protein